MSFTSLHLKLKGLSLYKYDFFTLGCKIQENNNIFSLRECEHNEKLPITDEKGGGEFTISCCYCNAKLSNERERKNCLKQIPVDGKYQTSALQLCHTLCDGKAKAVSFGIAGRIASCEAFHQFLL